MKGRRQVGILTSAERGQLITAALCMSAAVISGWMQTHIFIEWMHYFIKHVKPSKDDPVLLLLDGHATHTKKSRVNRSRQEIRCYSTMLSTPLATHRLQPLDVSFMAPLSTFYSQEELYSHTFNLHQPGKQRPDLPKTLAYPL
ncbi:hypothetical protein NQ318_023576, partial [Aromia moschata]